MQCVESLRVQAYFDGEFDAVSAADVERHAEVCAECRALLEELEQTRAALRQDLNNAGAPPALRALVMRMLDQENAIKSPRVDGGWLRSWRHSHSGGAPSAASVAPRSRLVSRAFC